MQSTDRQKDQTAQIATAMRQMSSTVLQVSDNSASAAVASRQAAAVAHAGGNIVEEALTKMRAIAGSVSSTGKKLQELDKSSDKIGRIIGVIDDIADQTNLLALNAAIEAAQPESMAADLLSSQRRFESWRNVRRARRKKSQR